MVALLLDPNRLTINALQGQAQGPAPTQTCLPAVLSGKVIASSRADDAPSPTNFSSLRLPSDQIDVPQPAQAFH